jgi:hypothetical protein
LEPAERPLGLLMSFGTVSLVLHYLELTRIFTFFIELSGLLGWDLKKKSCGCGGCVVLVRHCTRLLVKILHCCV